MWESVFNIAIANGIFAVLFVSLLIYQLKDSSNREKKYQKTIERLSDHLKIVENIKAKVEDVDRNVDVIKENITHKKVRKKNEIETQKQVQVI